MPEYIVTVRRTTMSTEEATFTINARDVDEAWEVAEEDVDAGKVTLEWEEVEPGVPDGGTEVVQVEED
jgi:hypothetical protein